MKRLGSITVNDYVFAVTVQSNRAYLAMKGGGMVVVDVANPSAPSIMGRYASSTWASRSVTVNGNYAYLASMEAGLEILDVSDPGNPVLVGHCLSFAIDVFLLGHYAIVAEAELSGISLWDVADPSHPVRVANAATSGRANGVAGIGNHIYVADGEGGLVVFELSGVVAGQRHDLIGSWKDQGIFVRNSDDGTWSRVSSAATQVAAGDLDGDGKDDLLGIWTGSGTWVKYSTTGQWVLLATPARWVSTGDTNGDGKVDVVGIGINWSGSGIPQLEAGCKSRRVRRRQLWVIWMAMVNPI